MSLVAYYSSSGEESENEEVSDAETTIKPSTTVMNIPIHGTATTSTRKEISDEFDYGRKSDDEEGSATNLFRMRLPKPSQPTTRQAFEEEDDEFLQKKATAYDDIEKPPLPKSIVKAASKPRQPVKITIPSLSVIEKEIGPTVPKNAIIAPQPQGNGLINLLPAPKVTLGGGKSTLSSPLASMSSSTAPKPAMIPHAVKKQIDGKKAATKQSATVTSSVTKCTLSGLSYNSSDSEASDVEDFFSLNHELKLPEVSANEIEKMVASKSAKLAETSHKLNKELENSRMRAQEEYAAMQAEAAQRSELAVAKQRRDRDIQALCGTRAKRARGHEDIEFIELSHAEVLPQREEWLRTQLAGETQYQPKGLVGYEDPGTGTKKKHQITYLAYQAKANESELQAMWAANRQSRKQTQSKYGF